jgi:hypothetical protein
MQSMPWVVHSNQWLGQEFSTIWTNINKIYIFSIKPFVNYFVPNINCRYYILLSMLRIQRAEKCFWSLRYFQITFYPNLIKNIQALLVVVGSVEKTKFPNQR